MAAAVSSSRIYQRRALDWICLRCQSRQKLASSRRFVATQARDVFPPRSLDNNTHTDENVPASLSALIERSFPGRTTPKRKPRLPDGPARTRFAPSPTGYLHIGGLRTALFSYLLAKRTGGQFILRIEDTDQKRLVNDAEEKLCADLQWAGLQWDEGPLTGGEYGPYRQSERGELYQAHAQQLLDRGAAYRCFCSPQPNASGQGTAYVTSGCYQNCSSLTHDESKDRAEQQGQQFTVRLQQPADAHKRTYPDLVYGKIQRLKRSAAPQQQSSSAEDGGDVSVDAADTILVKSDGTPTYHFANVVDDHLMKITHVIRGAEWMASTPLHYDIYSAFGWTPPQFAHVGLLVDENQAKLSKRNSDIALDVASLRDTHGVLPYTLTNYLALLGWSNPTSLDVMDMEMLISNFDLKFTRGNTMVKLEKLWHLQRQHVAMRCAYAEATGSLAPVTDLVEEITAVVRKTFADSLLDGLRPTSANQESDNFSAYCTNVLLGDHNKFETPEQWVRSHWYFFERAAEHEPEAGQVFDQSGKYSVSSKALEEFATVFVDTIDWSLDEHSHPRSDKDFGLNIYKGKKALENVIHTHCQERVWRAVLGGFHINLADGDHSTIPQSDLLPVSAEELQEWLQTTKGHSMDAVVKAITKDPKYGETAFVTTLEWRSKILNAIIMKYLRRRLTGGAPGSSLNWIMALIGKSECERRLRTKPSVS